MSFNFNESIDRLPAELADDEYWAGVRNATLEDLRRDAEGLPMTTSQLMLMERMATFYALSRKREAGETSISPSDMRQNYSLWMSLTAEFNKQITVGEDKRRHAMLESIMKVIDNTVMLVEDERVREDIRKNLADGFRAEGL